LIKKYNCIVCGKECLALKFFCSVECKRKFLLGNYNTHEVMSIFNNEPIEKNPRTEKEKGFINKVFDKMRTVNDRKKRESELKERAREQALSEIEPELVKHYKEKEFERLKGGQGSGVVKVLGNLTKGLKESSLGDTDAINRMLGTGDKKTIGNLEKFNNNKGFM